jgi:type VI secretion system secreted protein Hcp
MKMNAGLLVLCVMFAGTSRAVHAAPVGQMSCTTSAQTLKFNVSYFDFGVTQTLNIGSSSGGAGAGKATFQPLVVHTSFAPFLELVDAATSGKLFESCTLTTKNSAGEVFEFLLKTVGVKEVDAIAQSATPDAGRTAYTQVTLEYLTAQITYSGSTADDGGISPANDGWVKVKNQSSN